MNESNLGGIPSQQVQNPDARTGQPQATDRPAIERFEQQKAEELTKPVKSEGDNRSGDTTKDGGSGVVVDLKSIPRAALPTVTGVSPARALSYAVAALKVEMSTLFVILGQSGESSGAVAEKVGSAIEAEVLSSAGYSGGTVAQKVGQAVDGFQAPPVTTSSGISLSAADVASISISVQDLNIGFSAAGTAPSISFSSVDVSIERTSGEVLTGATRTAFARDVTGSEVDLGSAESGILFVDGSDPVRAHIARVGTRPEVAREFPEQARGSEPVRVATYGPQAVRSGAAEGSQDEQAGLEVLRGRIDRAVTSLITVKGGTLREAEGEKGLAMLSLDVVRPLFARREGVVQLADGLVEFAQAAERATLDKDKVGASDTGNTSDKT